MNPRDLQPWEDFRLTCWVKFDAGEVSVSYHLEAWLGDLSAAGLLHQNHFGVSTALLVTKPGASALPLALGCCKEAQGLAYRMP